MRKYLVVVVGFLFLFSACSSSVTDKLVKARSNKNPVERATAEKPDITIDKAYEMEKALVDKLMKKNKEKHIGYKLSPNTVPDKDNPEKTVPVYGYLFESMIVPVGETLKKSDFIDLHLENEVAFVVGKEIIPAPIKTPVDLKQYIKEVVPAIEMPDVRYAGPLKDITGIDLVIDNVAASKVMLGEGTSPTGVDSDLVSVKTTRDGEVINEGISTMVMGSPWNALFWLVHELEKKGETLKPGMVVITGSINRFMDSDPGLYEATYEGLGTITFRIIE